MAVRHGVLYDFFVFLLRLKAFSPPKFQAFFLGRRTIWAILPLSYYLIYRVHVMTHDIPVIITMIASNLFIDRKINILINTLNICRYD